MPQLCSSRTCVHAGGVHRTFCRFIFERRRSLCALQTFLLLTHCLAKSSPAAQLFPGLTFSVAICIEVWARSLRLKCLRNRDPGRDSEGLLRSCTEHRQGNSPGVLAKEVSQKSIGTTPWLCGHTFDRQSCAQNCLAFIDIDSPSHTVRDLLHCINSRCSSSVVQVWQQIYEY